MTQQGQWVCFGPDRAFAYKIETGRVVPFEPTPTGWNLTVDLEAPNDANEKLHTVMQLAATERRIEQQSPGLPPKVAQHIAGGGSGDEGADSEVLGDGLNFATRDSSGTA